MTYYWMFSVLLTSAKFSMDASAEQLYLTPEPFVFAEENTMFTLTCKYDGAKPRRDLLWRIDYGYTGRRYLIDQNCVPYDTFTDRSFSCNESLGEYNMTFINTSRGKHGQAFQCLLNTTSTTTLWSPGTVLLFKEIAPEMTCLKETEFEICPHPFLRVKENQTATIVARVNSSRSWTEMYFIQERRNFVDYDSYIKFNPDCSMEIYPGPIPGHNALCTLKNSAEASFTLTIDSVKKNSHGQHWLVLFLFNIGDGIGRNVFIYLDNSTSVTTTLPPSSTENSTSVTTTFPPSSTASPTTQTSIDTTTKANSTIARTNGSSHATTTTPLPIPEERTSDKYDLGLELNLKVEMEYQQAYGNKTSEEFRCLSTNFSVSLSENFRSICGFKWIEILQIQPNPVIVNFTIHVLPDVDIKQFLEAIIQKVLDLNYIAGIPVDKVYAKSMTITLENLKTKDKCDIASENVCRFGYYCKQASSSMICIDRCNSSVCENNGECYISHHSNDVQCRCPISNGIVFTGKRCETKQMITTTNETNLYLIIACSVVGGIVPIFIITFCVMNWKRRSLKKKLSTCSSLELSEMNIGAVNSMGSSSNRDQETSSNRMDRGTQYHITKNPDDRGDGDRRGGDPAHGSDDGYSKVQDDGRSGGDSAYGSDDGYIKVQGGSRGEDESAYGSGDGYIKVQDGRRGGGESEYGSGDGFIKVQDGSSGGGESAYGSGDGYIKVQDGRGGKGESEYGSGDGFIKVQDGSSGGGESAIGSGDGYVKARDGGRGGVDSTYNYIY